METVKELRKAAKMTQQAFADYFGVPKRTVEDWESEKSAVKSYLLELMEYKLRHENLI